MAAATVRHIPLGPHAGEVAVAVAVVEQEAVPFWSYWHLAVTSQGVPADACCESIMNSETCHAYAPRIEAACIWHPHKLVYIRIVGQALANTCSLVACMLGSMQH